LTFTDSFGRNLNNLGFGFGSRTGGSNNEHYIKGLLVTKLGSDPSKYSVDNISPLANNLYVDNTPGNQKLGIGTSSPDSTLEVDGTESHKTVVTSGAGFAASNYVTMGTGTGITTSPACSNAANGNGTTNFTASSTVVGTGTSFAATMVGDQIVLPDGVIDTIASYTSATSITTNTTHIECPGAYTVLTSAITIAGTSSPTISIGTTGTSATASTTNIGTSTGATQDINLGSTGSGNAAAGTTVNIQGGTTANTAVTIGTNGAGGITLDTGTTGTINIGGNANAKTYNIGAVGSTNANSTFHIADSTAAIQAITIGSTSSSSSVLIQGGSSDITLTTATNNKVQIGSSTTDGNSTILVLDSFNSTTEPTETDGAMYYSTALNTFRCGALGIWTNCGGFASSITNAPTVGASSTAENAFTTTAATDQTFTIPANFCQPGKVIKINAWGYYSVTSTTAPTITIRLRLDSNAGTLLGATAAAVSVASVTNQEWYFNTSLACKTAGSSGTVDSEGWYLISTTGNSSFTQNQFVATSPPADITVNTTTSHVIVPTAQFSLSGASNVATLRQFTITSAGP